ncbi:uncharacterized protein [Venturia canescens]|nr:uncharacterized protein LOC122415321 isoform X2 [Venturia canescens]XP_043283277.1 uncharacterized protein LOC122415321 isoform X2 [Venturia canescens]XP_043283278.1 uncharacterized protein LOC122415321 isoform X2 [Venturia canescens]XP_043283279.1 uncharacterized protein LOC122415321 isoform X2 [Venturia canescens]XP_043283280.1 uncharacterized protein LOC122415321 isoform X2 [Venturia canescens]XP_043283281.1 uncharacterized protein LOC122415321 isoform X2 [Venturia canescens]
MDLAETMKNIVAKGMQTEMGSPGAGSGYPSSAGSAGYITEKMYMLLQFYLQNKGWNPSSELLQCFTELKEASMLPSGPYLQMMASRVALDAQGRLVLRENGKIILPYEHFANAVMLKHMNTPHGMHLGLEGTVRAVMESYTIGRECFGMEKEFIIEVVQNCPNPACRYYKNQLELTQKMVHMGPTYIQDNEAAASLLRSSFSHNTDFQSALSSNTLNPHMSSSSNEMSDLRNAANQMNLQRPPSRPSLNIPHRPSIQEKKQPTVKQHYESLVPPVPLNDHKITDFLRSNLDNLEGLSGLGLGNLQSLSNANKDLLALHNGAWTIDNEKSRTTTSNNEGGQEKVVRAFAEVMKNMARMKSCVRPAMCKPYGKQSEALQKTLVDTIQLVQSLRSFLPPPHIPVSSWKNEDKHRLDHNTGSYLPTLRYETAHRTGIFASNEAIGTHEQCDLNAMILV